MAGTHENVKLNYALQLASEGFRIAILRPQSKTPVPGTSWKADATNNPEQIKHLFANRRGWNYLVAPDEGHFVVDLDVKGDKHGDADLENLELDFGFLPPTLTVRTPSGGQHRYFKGTAPTSAGKKSLGSGIDIRGNFNGKGGYVVGPGSCIGDKFYTVETNAPIAAAPDWLIDRCRQRAVEPLKRQPGRMIGNDFDRAQMHRYLMALVEDGDVAIEGCHGNERTYQLFCRLLDYLPPEMALELVADMWNPHCVPAWDYDELRTICNNAAKYRQNDIGAKASRDIREVFGPYALAASSELAKDDPVFPDITKSGALRATTANARVALQAIGLECSHDVFHDTLIVGGRALDQWAGQLTDEVTLRLAHMIHEKFGFEPEPHKMHCAVQQLCFLNKFNPVTDYLAGLQWDGVERIETWLIEHAGAPDTPFVRAVSRIVLVAAVRRARHPGCKFDEILVLEGCEGLGKSGMIELMAGRENFSDQSILAADDRKQQEQMAGVWLYEIADLTGIRNAEVEKIKAFASRQADRCRPAYGRNVKDQKRQCVLIATTNDTDFLQSQTGNRRWWPVPVTKHCDLNALAAVRDQLWAETAHLEADGASIRLPRELWAVAGEEQEKRRLSHPWEEILATVTGQKFPVPGRDDQHEERVFSADVFKWYLKLEPSKQDRWNGKIVKQMMRRLSWEHRPGVRIGARVGPGYVRAVEGPLPATSVENDELPNGLFVTARAG